jgi:hypothetical protein
MYQVNSMNRAIIHDFDTLLNTLTWVEANKKSRELRKRHPDRVLTVRFEDFVANEESVVRRICGFLGLDFLPEMLDIVSSDEAKKLAGTTTLLLRV